MTGEAGTGRQLQELLVEDDESVRTLVRYGLDATQIGLRVASGVREAWKLLEVEAFDAVILDLILPDGDGRRLLSELRAWPRTAKVPVVVLSAKGSRSIQLDCFRLGADEFFEKPFDPEVLGAVLIRQIQRAGTVVAEERLDSVTGLHSRASLATRFREVVAFGQGRDYVTAIINIDMTSVGSWAERNNVIYASYQELAAHPDVCKMIERRVDEVNSQLAVEPRMGGAQIRRFLILHKELDADDGELTRTMKVRRALISERYGSLIEALYDGSKDASIAVEVTFEDGRKGRIEGRMRIVDMQPHAVEAEMMKEAAE